MFVGVSLHVLLLPFCMSVCYLCEDDIASDDVLINNDCTTAYVVLVVTGYNTNWAKLGPE